MSNLTYRWTTIILTFLASVALTVGIIKTFNVQDMAYLTYTKEQRAYSYQMEDQGITFFYYNSDTNVFVVEGTDEMWTTYHTVKARNKWYGQVLGFWTLSLMISLLVVALPLALFFETRAYSQKARQDA